MVGLVETILFVFSCLGLGPPVDLWGLRRPDVRVNTGRTSGFSKRLGLSRVPGEREDCSSALKASINYPNGHSPKSWVEEKGTPPDCCEWFGVECINTTRRVVKLGLNYTRESWTLGDWFLNASKFLPCEVLRALHLPYNSIVGCIANEGLPSFHFSSQVWH
ncbi:hypothetical protein Acr_00g0076190 [Actinidia rufa]|uniref:Leucine-rich repeat-containing N-terminal plant-type domain-containing protein n=1 Tax=Actinidia rufa TaxID=165716 RepID=A0A7J0DSV4_9ERIC|nr:hypothetical protein Acr_00g0076190 [Actinidia rufa]